MPVLVNGKTITDEEIYQEMQYHPAASAEEAMEKAAKALAIRALLLQKATALQIQAEAEDDQAPEEALIDALLTSVITLPDPDDETIERFYHQNAHHFKKEEGVTLPLTEAKDAIKDYILETAWQNSLREYIRHLVLEAKIEGVAILD